MAASFRSRGHTARERSNRHAHPGCIADSFPQRFQKSYPKYPRIRLRSVLDTKTQKKLLVVVLAWFCAAACDTHKQTYKLVKYGAVCWFPAKTKKAARSAKISRCISREARKYPGFARAAGAIVRKYPGYCGDCAKVSRLFPRVSAKISRKLGTLNKTQIL